MKTLLSLLIALAMATCAFAQEDSSKAAGLSDELSTAFAKGSLKKTGDLFADEASVYWVHAKLNKQKFGQFLQGQIDTFTKRALVFNQEGSAENETLSTSWGSFFIEYGNDNNMPVNHQVGRYSAVAQKKDGKWQIVSLHLSLPFPPDLPDPIK